MPTWHLVLSSRGLPQLLLILVKLSLVKGKHCPGEDKAKIPPGLLRLWGVP